MGLAGGGGVVERLSALTHVEDSIRSGAHKGVLCCCVAVGARRRVVGARETGLAGSSILSILSRPGSTR